jgi:hypothetical protein
MYPPYLYPPPYNPQEGYADPLKMAKKQRKMLDKAIKAATEAEKEKHKDKVSKPKSKWEKLDVIHSLLAMFIFMFFAGPWIWLIQITSLQHFVEALKATFK